MTRFSILSLMTLTAAVAFTIAAVSNWSLSTTLSEQGNRIKLLEQNERTYIRISQLLSITASPDHAGSQHHYLVARIVKALPNTTLDNNLYNPVLGIGQTLLADVDGDLGGLEMLAIHHNSLSVPGGSDTVIALFDNTKLIDVIGRADDNRLDSLDVSFFDSDGDGDLEAVIVVRQGAVTTKAFRSGQQKETIVYNATLEGLELAGAQNAG